MKRYLILLAALLCAPGARAEDCILDRCADKTPPATTNAAPAETPAPATPQTRWRMPWRTGSVASGSFDFYVLALSWSPTFCETSGGEKSQCEPGRKLGFVVHGLWPQYDHGFPNNCDGASFVSRLALDHARGVYPDEGLARYEWRKHGTCTGRSPSDYFDDVARAKALVTIPSAFAETSGERTIATQDVERGFENANPRLRPGMMSVGCRRGALEDVRICVSKDLRDFIACPEVARRGCRAREINVPAPM